VRWSAVSAARRTRTWKTRSSSKRTNNWPFERLLPVSIRPRRPIELGLIQRTSVAASHARPVRQVFSVISVIWMRGFGNAQNSRDTDGQAVLLTATQPQRHPRRVRPRGRSPKKTRRLTPQAVAIPASRCEPGDDFPASQRHTADGVTPSSCASCSCVRPAAWRQDRILRCNSTHTLLSTSQSRRQV
jgi:hypothetical protein